MTPSVADNSLIISEIRMCCPVDFGYKEVLID